MSHLKRCKQCERWKPLTEYHSHKGTKDRKQTHCKECGSRALALARAQERVIEAYQTLHRREELLCSLIDSEAP